MPEDDILVALLRDVDGIGATTARTIAEEFADAEDLRDAVEDIPPGYSPTRLSRLDGFGPTRARTMAKWIDESGVLDVATDGAAVIDLDCVDCPATVHEDVRGRSSGGASA